MNRTRLVPIVFAVAILALVTADASAYHHPTLGRWMQRDPVGYEDGMNLYQYCGTSPLIYVDPYGTDKGPCLVKQVKGPHGDGTFARHGERDEDYWRRLRKIKDAKGKKHKLGHTWLSCGSNSYGFYPDEYEKTLWGGEFDSDIPGLKEGKPRDPLDGLDDKGRQIVPDWEWPTEVPERPDGSSTPKLQGGDANGTPCCRATDEEILSCVDGVARRDWQGTKWSLKRHCQDMVVDILEKCCMTVDQDKRIKRR